MTPTQEWKFGTSYDKMSATSRIPFRLRPAFQDFIVILFYVSCSYLLPIEIHSGSSVLMKALLPQHATEGRRTSFSACLRIGTNPVKEL
jgi:hypothetical protein